ncbi:hypothetical protein [Streptomyces lydicus]|uniref:hypothetical protein n=1 Tax=Streptomyces lydicus TaxID=47763 RepID=UPI0037A78D72
MRTRHEAAMTTERLDAPPEDCDGELPPVPFLDCLRRLDARLAEAVAAAQASYGSGAGRDSFRGLHLGADHVTRMLRRAPAASPIGPGTAPGIPGLGWLAQRYELSAFELNVLLVALAPEVDPRYERLYGYLQDDGTWRAAARLCADRRGCRGGRLRRRAPVRPQPEGQAGRRRRPGSPDRRTPHERAVRTDPSPLAGPPLH